MGHNVAQISLDGAKTWFAPLYSGPLKTKEPWAPPVLDLPYRAKKGEPLDGSLQTMAGHIVGARGRGGKGTGKVKYTSGGQSLFKKHKLIEQARLQCEAAKPYRCELIYLREELENPARHTDTKCQLGIWISTRGVVLLPATELVRELR